jgi:hypothetical protein
MGSLTTSASSQVLRALFPQTTTSNSSGALSTNQAAFRIYTTATGAGQSGVFSASANVIHQMTLILGTNPAVGNPAPAIPLTDANVLANTLVTTGGISAGTINFANNALYSPTSGSVGASVAMNTGSGWTGWTLDLDGSKARARNNGSITFPQLATGSVNVWGWCISALATAANTPVNPQTSTQLHPVADTLSIIAYGDLSFARQVSAGDTPSFTGSALVITLD